MPEGGRRVGGALALPALAPERARAAARPHILVILVDDLGFGDLASWGAPDMRTPHIDALMSCGMRFDRFYANCPVCSPTRASLLTGRFPDLVGVPGVIRTHAHNSWGWLSPEAVMLPTILKRAGYHTGIVGKWHLGLTEPDEPNSRGFDYFKGFLGDMMDDYYKHRRHGRNYMRLGRKEIDPPGHATDLFSRWAVDYIKERAGAGKPFFLYLAYNAPHTPIQPPKEWVAKVKEREAGISAKRAKLVALIEHMDDGIGQVIEALERSGAASDTIVVFVSDNGGQGNVGARNAPLRGAKQDMWEGGIRVPMCAVWPGHIAAGSRSDAVATTMDIFPTLAEAGGARFSHEIDGVSFLPELTGGTRRAGRKHWNDRTLFWCRREGGRRYKGGCYYAARRGPWKLLRNAPSDPFRLFDLDDDPGESRALPETRPEFRELREALKAHVEPASRVAWRRPG
ncbi:MAG: sulfatase-like hydrolase/transferase [Planctomycetota bacterium]